MIQNPLFLFYRMESSKNTLCKAERLNSKKSIELLFDGNSCSFGAYPLRAVFLTVEKLEGEAPVSIMISVPKKKFKRAVKRNRIKRQIREAYRKNKHQLTDLLVEKNKRLLIAFIFVDNKLYDSGEIENKLKVLLNRIRERIEKDE